MRPSSQLPLPRNPNVSSILQEFIGSKVRAPSRVAACSANTRPSRPCPALSRTLPPRNHLLQPCPAKAPVPSRNLSKPADERTLSRKIVILAFETCTKAIFVGLRTRLKCENDDLVHLVHGCF
eukprot:711522-Pleurochrysis_carterae.AAC.1